MYDDKILLVFALVLVHSVKYIFFNIDNVFSTITFHNVQTAAISNYISMGKNTHNFRFYGLVQYSLFGFFPDVDVKDSLSDAMWWVNRNKFILSLTVLFVIIAISFVIKILVQYIRCKKKSEEVRECNSIKWLSYHNFTYRMILIAYFNITTIAIAEITHMTSNLALDLLALMTFLAVSIGFPVYIAIILDEHIYKLNEPRTKLKYGPFYLQFKPNGVNIRFIVILIIKQLLYAIIINIRGIHDLHKNTMLFIIALIYLLFLYYRNPYKRKVHQKSSKIMAMIALLMLTINYVLILDHVSVNVKNKFKYIAYSLQLFIVLIAIITSSIYYIRHRHEDMIIVEQVEDIVSNYVRSDDSETSVSKASDNDSKSDKDETFELTDLEIGAVVDIATI